MREGLFIKKNVHKWVEYQHDSAADPDEKATQFTELVNDLGYAKTFYPQSRVTAYLNNLANRIYLGIYKNKKEDSSRIARFWKTELPLTLYRYRKEMLYSFLIFIIFAAIAAFSAAHDQGFVRGVLTDEYVDMTEDNISKGDPFGVYKNDNQLNMFLYIALNNIQVAFMFFVAGAFLSIGTVLLLFENGVIVGAFQYFFFARGLGWKSVLVIWLHGTLEISSFIVAGAAGFVLGNSILFPGTFTRKKSLQRGAKDGSKMLIGLMPLFILAAFIEGFITRYATMPLWLSCSILAASLFFVVWYFVLYPVSVHNQFMQKASSSTNQI